VYGEGHLGQGASEAAARHARYEFLSRVVRAAGADAIVTAHHKDDTLETAIINMKRGTGRKGLSGIRSIDGIKRPLLRHSKADIHAYAKRHNLMWREDSTNLDTKYLRNHVRHNVVTRLTEKQKEQLHRHIQHMHLLNTAIDELLADYLQRYSYKNRLKRHEFIMLPHAVALEVMAAWLRKNGIHGFDKKTLERLTHTAKIHTVGRRVPVSGRVSLKVSGEFLALVTSER
jgi:tRNA(Ile)-lysidine synthase TilS/MesJ